MGTYEVVGVNGWSLQVAAPFATMVFVGTFGEVLCRGIVFRIIEKPLGSWIALVLSSLLFGLAHVPGEGIGVLGSLITIVAGAYFAAAYMRTRRLWLCIGIHVAWNYTLGSIFSSAVSGREAKGLLLGRLSGPDWLTGGILRPGGLGADLGRSSDLRRISAVERMAERQYVSAVLARPREPGSDRPVTINTPTEYGGAGTHPAKQGDMTCFRSTRHEHDLRHQTCAAPASMMPTGPSTMLAGRGCTGGMLEMDTFHDFGRRLRNAAITVLAGWLLLAVSPVAKATPGNLPLQMERSLREEGLSGAVWAIVGPDGDIVGASGRSNARTQASMTVDNRVQVGSVGKVVLAIGVLRLVTEGRLSLETPVADVLPQVPLDNPWSDTDPLRIKHLLAHTAGLDHSRFWQVFSLAPRPDTPLIASVTGDATLLRVQTRPGSRYAYSNVGYALLGMVIESVTRGPYERYMDEKVLKPLSMNDSTFHFVTQTGPEGDGRLAMGHFEDGVVQAAIPMYLRAAGQFTTTATDMSRFARFLMGDGTVDGEGFVAPELMGALGEPQGTDAALAGLPIGHGLALAGRDRHGAYGWCHPGTTYGFVAMLCVFPGQDRAFFVGTNTDSETADYDRLNRLLIDELALARRPNVITKSPPVDVAQWEGLYVSMPKAMSNLAWIDDTLNFVRVRWDGRQLHIKPMQSQERVLDPVGGRLFRASDRNAASHVLLTTPDGARVVSDGLRSYERISTVRVVLRWVSLVAGLLGLAYVAVSGVVRTLFRRMSLADPMLIPLLGVLAMAIPIPLFHAQSFLQLGDRTVASEALAFVSAALPVTLLFGLVKRFRQGSRGAPRIVDAVALLAALQWQALLAIAGLVPFRLWQ